MSSKKFSPDSSTIFVLFFVTHFILENPNTISLRLTSISRIVKELAFLHAISQLNLGYFHYHLETPSFLQSCSTDTLSIRYHDFNVYGVSSSFQTSSGTDVCNPLQNKHANNQLTISFQLVSDFFRQFSIQD